MTPTHLLVMSRGYRSVIEAFPLPDTAAARRDIPSSIPRILTHSHIGFHSSSIVQQPFFISSSTAHPTHDTLITLLALSSKFDGYTELSFFSVVLPSQPSESSAGSITISQKGLLSPPGEFLCHILGTASAGHARLITLSASTTTKLVAFTVVSHNGVAGEEQSTIDNGRLLPLEYLKISGMRTERDRLAWDGFRGRLCIYHEKRIDILDYA